MNTAALTCPHCPDPDNPLSAVGPGAIGCANGHRFDVARQGYVALLGPRARTDTADSAAMITARADFLAAGHFAGVAAAVAQAVPAGPVLEIGAGTGYYLSGVLDRVGGTGIALDASKSAARRAAADPRLTSVVADAWARLPVRSGSMGAVLSVFAPRNPAEVGRVLRPGGVLVAVTPDPAHLTQVRDRLGMLDIDEGKPDRLDEAFRGVLIPTARTTCAYAVDLTAADLAALVGMGPSAHHVDPAALTGRIAQLPDPSPVTVAVTVGAYTKAVSGPGGTAARRP